MYYGEIKEYDIANGEGIRVSLFVSGCTNHCAGCFQPQTWDFHFGKPFDAAAEQKILDFLKLPYADGVTFLGGEPMEPENQKELLRLAKKIKQDHPDKTIWCYTGFVLEKDLVPGGKRFTEDTEALLSRIDVLVDGPFIQNLKNISLSFRGSENQRVIDMKRTRETQRVVKYLE